MKKNFLALTMLIICHYSYAQNTFPWPSSGNVGIGTTSPTAPLHVIGTARINMLSLDEGGVGIGYLGRGGNITSGFSGSSEVLALTYNRRDFIVGGWGKSDNAWKGAALYINSDNGNVGIGTTTPANRLTVNGNVQVTGNPGSTRYIVTDETSTGTTQFIMQAGAGSAAYGGAINLYGQANSAHPGWVKIGLGSGAGATGTATEGRFTVNNQGLDGGTDLFTVLRTGNVGIGTTTPTNRLTVNGNLQVTGNPESTRYIVTDETSTGTTQFIMQAGAGSAAYGGAINLYGQANSVHPGWVKIGLGSGAGATGTATEGRFTVNNQGLGRGADLFTVLRTGNVGIGTIAPAYKLDVIGTIRAREIKVDMNGADFVFEKGYNLVPLDELEKFVKENKHLPEVPPAEEMKVKGTDLGALNVKLLQKIEEMTLYIIEQNKKMSALEEKIHQIEKNLE